MYFQQPHGTEVGIDRWERPVPWPELGRRNWWNFPIFGGFPDIFLEQLAKMMISSSGG